MRGIQYAAAYRFNHWRLWNTGSPACRLRWSFGAPAPEPRRSLGV